jgi:beta-phosphoglucomutase-like phosphatase (HAD superfamily)
MDGTLVDSIQAVEAAWTSVALELGQSPEEVIAATHGRRAIDNLRDLKPKLRRLTNDQMEPHVEEVSPGRILGAMPLLLTRDIGPSLNRGS